MLGIGFFAASASGGGGGVPAYELISTTVLTTTSTQIDLTSIPSTYKHLQIRLTARHGSNIGGAYHANLWFNGSQNADYAWHFLQGNGSTVSSAGQVDRTEIRVADFPDSTSVSGSFGTSVIDILDYASTSKNKTVRSLTGFTAASSRINLGSGHWRSLSAVTSISIQGQSFIAGSRFSLYGIKG